MNRVYFFRILCILFNFSINSCSIPSSTSTTNVKKTDEFNTYKQTKTTANLLPNCEAQGQFFSDTKNYFLAVTLNGKLNLIDAIHGRIKWARGLQPGPLLSSTIGDVVKIHNNNGELVQILPSLDGNLYVYQSDTVKKTQFSAEKLLKSSLKFNEDVLLVGGQESSIIGFKLNTGELLYDCGHSGCSRENDSLDDDVILLRKNSQSVRAVNIMSGIEEWHFVVGDPQVIKITNQECHSNDRNDKYSVTYKVMVPNGLIKSFVHYTNESSQSEIYNSWTLRLDSPIVSMWHLENDHLRKVNLFDPNINSFTDFGQQDTRKPYLYLGSFNNHYYIQTSTDQPESEKNEMIPVYEETKRTHKQAFIPVDTNKDNQTLDDGDKENTQLVVERRFPFLRNNDHFNATGYLIYNEDGGNNSDQCMPSNDQKIIGGNQSYETEEQTTTIIITEYVYTSLSYYWKEILCLCMIFSAALNTLWCLFKKFFIDSWRKVPKSDNSCFIVLDNSKECSGNNSETKLLYDALVNNVSNSELTNSQHLNYNSRYLEDFEQLSLLGKGGFGMVFEARHKIDEGKYAVKRICIPAIEEKRKKFLREIRALSKLDHVNIVRYYNAWVEEPPLGWQEEQDRIHNYDLTTYKDTSMITTATNIPKKVSSIKNLQISNNNNIRFSMSFDENSLIHRSPSQDSLEIVFEKSLKDQSKQHLKNEKNDDKIEDYYSETSSSSEEELMKNENLMTEKNIKKHQIIQSFHNGHHTKHPVPKTYIYIQMQLCKKETLKDWLFRNQQRDLNKMVDIFVQILRAVQYVHLNNLIHRDLKPSNIFFSMDGLIKIGDFGLATTIVDEMNELENKNPLHSMNYKHTNHVGTQLYMSPEQIKNQSYDHKVDIYSMGIILYELLMPFNTESERIFQLQNVRNKKFPNMFQEKHSKEKIIIQKLMADSPKDRPESAEILLYDMFSSAILKK